MVGQHLELGSELSWPPSPGQLSFLRSTLLPSIHTGQRMQEAVAEPTSIHACLLRGGLKALKMLLL